MGLLLRLGLLRRGPRARGLLLGVALTALAGCGPGVFLLPDATPEPWPQTGGDAAGAAWRAAGLNPPLRLRWSGDLDGAPLGGPLVADGVVLQLTMRATLYAFERAGGHRVGKVGFDAEVCAPPAVAGPLLVYSRLGKEPALRALNRMTGRERWTCRGRFCAPLVVRHDTLVAAAEDGAVLALRTTDGTQLWKAQAGRPRAGVAWAGDLVYAAGGPTYLVALRASDGTEAWRAELGSALRSRPLAGQGALYCATARGRVLSLDPLSGAVVWEAFVDGLPSSGMALAPQALVLGASDRRIRALEPRTGALLWTVDTDGVVRGAPGIGGSTAYCGSADGHLYAVDLQAGTVLWKQKLDGPGLTPVALADGTVAVTTEEGTLYVFGR